MSQSKRTKLSYKEALGVESVDVHIGEIPPRPAPPGVIRYLSTEAVPQGISTVLLYSLYPVILEPTKSYASLSDALTNSSIQDNGKAIIQPYPC